MPDGVNEEVPDEVNAEVEVKPLLAPPIFGFLTPTTQLLITIHCIYSHSYHCCNRSSNKISRMLAFNAESDFIKTQKEQLN